MLRAGGEDVIVMQSRKARRYAGRIDNGVDIHEALLQVCKDHQLRTADLRGIGYLSSARLGTWNPETNALEEAETPLGPVQLLSLTGNVSRRGDAPDLHLMAQLLVGTGDSQRVVGGRLLGGEVLDLEFFIDAIDDFAFVRADEEGAIRPWIQIETEAHRADESESHRSEFMPGRLGARPDESETEYELQRGDRLQHPKLGLCEVILVPDDDRASIRLQNGRAVELHLGLLKLVRTRLEDNGRQHFKVQVRRRNT